MGFHFGRVRSCRFPRRCGYVRFDGGEIQSGKVVCRQCYAPFLFIGMAQFARILCRYHTVKSRRVGGYVE